MDDAKVLEGLREVEARDKRLSTFLARNEAELTALWRTDDPKQHGNKERWEERAEYLRSKGYSAATGNAVRVAWARLRDRRVEEAHRARTVNLTTPTVSRAGFATMGSRG